MANISKHTTFQEYGCGSCILNVPLHGLGVRKCSFCCSSALNSQHSITAPKQVKIDEVTWSTFLLIQAASCHTFQMWRKWGPTLDPSEMVPATPIFYPQTERSLTWSYLCTPFQELEQRLAIFTNNSNPIRHNILAINQRIWDLCIVFCFFTVELSL